jgi:hypothetical protein
MIVTCPSGLQGEIRKLRGSEGKLLTDRSLAKTGGFFEALAGACWTSTTDAGVYPFVVVGDAQPDWRRVLMGDRFYMLIQIRIATFGDELALKTQCGFSACREPYEWELNLSDLPVRQLPSKSRELLRTQQPFVDEIGGRKVAFHLPTGADDHKMTALRRQNNGNVGLIDAIAVRLTSIDGVKQDDRARRRFLEEQSLDDLLALLERFDAVDCGVDTAIETVCSFCGGQSEMQLPFDAEFFNPRRKRTATRERTPAPDPDDDAGGAP